MRNHHVGSPHTQLPHQMALELFRGAAVIRDIDLDIDRVSPAQLGPAGAEIAVGEMGIGQPVAEGEERLIRHVQILAGVADVGVERPPGGQPVVEHRHLPDIDRPGHRQPPRGIPPAAQHIADGVTGLAAQIPGGQHGAGPLEQP